MKPSSRDDLLEDLGGRKFKRRERRDPVGRGAGMLMTEQMLERVINHCMKELDFIWRKGIVGYIIPSITFSEFFFSNIYITYLCFKMFCVFECNKVE